ncbi:hypothetical protein ACS0TY_003480 [Phlomoides rotata]
MDKTNRNKELIEDIARESLIAISYKVPDTDRTAEISPNYINGGKAGEPLVGDNKEDYRSELISISYSSSDVEKVEPLFARGS